MKLRFENHIVRFTLIIGMSAGFVLSTTGPSPKAAAQEAAPAVASKQSPEAVDNNGRELVAKRWWESVPSIYWTSLRASRGHAAVPLKDPDALSKWLDEIKAQGFYALEIFSPAEIGTGGGLPTIDHYRIDPDLGTMDDFRQLVHLAHSKGLPIITHQQLSYSGIEAPHFLKA